MSNSACLNETELWELINTLSRNNHADRLEHLETCPACSCRFQQLEEMLDWIRTALVQPEFPQEFMVPVPEQQQMNSIPGVETWEEGLSSVATQFSEWPPRPRISVTPDAGVSYEICHAPRSAELSVKQLSIADGSCFSQANKNTADEQLEISAGEMVSRYCIIGRLGRGGQGDVYLAEDQQLKRHVAIKVGQISHDADPDLAALIEHEGLLLAKVNHPCLSQVYDSGVHAGHPYLVMEYVEGCTLHKLARDRKFRPSEIVRVMADIANGVQAMHAQGILHLDLKPENVMITPSGDGKLIDLGTGWQLHPEGQRTPRFWGGTAEYMAPEQRNKEWGCCGTATDVFGLGCILYFLLNNAPPWREGVQPSDIDGYAPRKVSQNEQCEQQSARSSSSSCTAVNKCTTGGQAWRMHLQSACRKAMADAPEARFATVEEFLQALHTQPVSRLPMLLIVVGVCLFLQGAIHRGWIDGAIWSHPGPVCEANDMFRSRQLLPNSRLLEARWHPLTIRAISREGQSLQFCFWADSTGLLFLPAEPVLQPPADPAESWTVNLPRRGLELDQLGDVYYLLAIETPFLGSAGDAALHDQLDDWLDHHLAEQLLDANLTSLPTVRPVLSASPNLPRLLGALFLNKPNQAGEVVLDLREMQVRSSSEKLLLPGNICPE